MTSTDGPGCQPSGDALMGTWEPYYPFPRPGEPGIFRVGCSCGKWEATGTAEDVGRASLLHDDAPWRQHVVTIRGRHVPA